MKLKHILEAFSDPVLRESYWGRDFSDYFKQFTKHRKEELYLFPGEYGERTYAQGIVGAVFTPFVDIKEDNQGGFAMHNLVMHLTNYAKTTSDVYTEINQALSYFTDRFSSGSLRHRWEALVTKVEEDTIDEDSIDEQTDDLAEEFMQKFNEYSLKVSSIIQHTESPAKGAFSFRRFIWGKMSPSVGAVKRIMMFVINAIQNSEHHAVLAARPHSEHGVTVYDTHYNTASIMQKIIDEHFGVHTQLLDKFVNADADSVEQTDFWNQYSSHWFFIDDSNSQNNIMVLQKSDEADVSVLDHLGVEIELMNEPENPFECQSLWALEFEKKYPHMELVREYLQRSPDLAKNPLVASDTDIQTAGKRFYKSFEVIVQEKRAEYEAAVEASREEAESNDEEIDEDSIGSDDYISHELYAYGSNFSDKEMKRVKQFLETPSSIRQKTKDAIEEYPNTELKLEEEFFHALVITEFVEEEEDKHAFT